MEPLTRGAAGEATSRRILRFTRLFSKFLRMLLVSGTLVLQRWGMPHGRDLAACLSFGPLNDFPAVRPVIHTALLLSALSASFLAGQSASAGHVTLSFNELERQFAESSTSAGAAGKPAQEQRQDPDPSIARRDIPDSSGLSAGSMSAPPVSSPSGGGSAGPADVAESASLPQCQICMIIRQDEWLFIPPRFLDGIFRPPRSVISL